MEEPMNEMDVKWALNLAHPRASAVIYPWNAFLSDQIVHTQAKKMYSKNW